MNTTVLIMDSMVHFIHFLKNKILPVSDALNVFYQCANKLYVCIYIYIHMYMYKAMNTLYFHRAAISCREDWFGIKRTSVCFQINLRISNTIWYPFNLIRFLRVEKNHSHPSSEQFWVVCLLLRVSPSNRNRLLRISVSCQ